MAAGTSAAEQSRGLARETLEFGTIIVVGGGCYGSYYVRQLKRAAEAGAARWSALVVVDRDSACLLSTLAPEAVPPRMRLEVATWTDYFAGYLALASLAPTDHESDTIVPSPLMPHLMAEWIMSRARQRWPDRRVEVAPLARAPTVPWQSAAADGTHYVSFAEWICPINCIEPARCPHTRGERSWSLPPALRRYADEERAASRPVEGPFVFHCSHRTHGVGMIDVKDVVAADAAIAARGRHGAATFLVGTASHCHGALQRIVLSA